MGRIAVEKNIKEFLNLKTSGTKIVVGDGPSLKKIKKNYRDVIFTGFKKGKELAAYFASADVFVFPSLDETFGLVMIEAIACGTPVAAHNVTGPKDVIENGANGFLDTDLQRAIKKCLQLDRKKVCESSKKWKWDACADIFLENLQKINTKKR